MRVLPTLVTTGALAGALLVAVPPASGSDDGPHRWSGIVRGGITVTGNTLGLSKGVGTTDPGTEDAIGRFLANSGTTTLWQDNASSAVLDLPAGASVAHAELVWAGSWDYGGQDLMGLLGTPVLLTFASSAREVASELTTAVTKSETDADSAVVRYYGRSNDVTDFVRVHGAGAYTVGGVPATNAAGNDTQNAAGWSLAVVYTHPDSPTRYVALDVGDMSWVDADTTQDLAYGGFCTPNIGTPQAKVVVSALEGDADRVGDQLLIGGDTGSLTPASGPNNPPYNVFASQLNDMSGSLDTRGGGDDHDAAGAVNTVGGRQGWDVTALATTPGQLGTGQDTLAVRAATTGDTFLPVLVGAQIDVGAPRPAAGDVSLDATSVPLGGSTTMTMVFDNTDGTSDAESVRLLLPFPAGVSVGAVTVDGAPSSATAVGTGSGIGDVAVGTSRVVRATLTGAAPGSHALVPSWIYDYEMCAGDDTAAQGSLTNRLMTLAVSAPQPTGADAPAPDTVAPDTKITQHPRKRGTRRTALFRFRSTEAGSTFTCKLDRRKARPCASPKRYPRLRPGRHVVRVWATDAAGNRDPKPATYTFRVVRKRGR